MAQYLFAIIFNFDVVGKCNRCNFIRYMAIKEKRTATKPMMLTLILRHRGQVWELTRLVTPVNFQAGFVILSREGNLTFITDEHLLTTSKIKDNNKRVLRHGPAYFT